MPPSGRSANRGVSQLAAGVPADHADARAAGQIFNVGSGSGVSFRTMAETVIREAGGGRIEARPWPDAAARVETGDFVADVARINGALGWRPATALDSGLREVIRQYRQMENVR